MNFEMSIERHVEVWIRCLPEPVASTWSLLVNNADVAGSESSGVCFAVLMGNRGVGVCVHWKHVADGD